MNLIEFSFNNYFRGVYKSFKVTPSLIVIWDSQWALKEYGISWFHPYYSLELWIDWFFWGAGIEIRFPIKKKKRKKKKS